MSSTAGSGTATRLKIHEIFYSLQGESTFAGLPCVLVRLTGCQMRCAWCDTAYAFYEGHWRTLDEIVEEVADYRCPLVEVTGGEPLLQPGALPLMRRLCDQGYEVLLETGGGLSLAEVDPRVRRILDIKCPDSGEVENNHWPNLELLTEKDELKLVLASRRDYEWARDLIHEHDLAAKCPVHLSPVVPVPAADRVEPAPGADLPGATGLDPAELAGWILEDRLPVRLQLQLHKRLWGAERRGV